MTWALLSRLLQLLGILMVLVGVAGYWLTQDVTRTPLTKLQRELLNVREDDFYASFVVAGRDILYEGGSSTPVYDENGQIVCWRYTGATSVYGTNTDTILYVGIINDEITMILLPRDIFIDEGTHKLNQVYTLNGAEGLKQRVSDLLGVPVDYYAIINLDIFEKFVDALGGVEVTVPVRMYHRDCTAGFTIDLQPGPQVLNGEQAAHFVRYRDLFRGDIDRLDNVKLLAYAMLGKLQQLHVRAVTKVPALIDTFFASVETNASPNLVRRLVPRLEHLRIKTTATLPTLEVTRQERSGLEVDEVEVSAFLASVFGGTAPAVARVPDMNLLITDRSGVAGLGAWYRERLVALGVPPGQVMLRSASPASSPTRLVATVETWEQADYYIGLFHVGKQQIDRIPAFQGEEVGLELVLGEDAAAHTAVWRADGPAEAGTVRE